MDIVKNDNIRIRIAGWV